MKIIDKEQVIRLYKKGFSFTVIQNLIKVPSSISSSIIKEAGLFNPRRQHDYYGQQVKNKRTN
jgi:hypothetical protein